MVHNKKLFEGLLKADGIEPAGAAESERIAFGKMLDQQSKFKQSKPGFRPDIWRIIMKSKITKLAVAAAIIIVAVIGIYHFGGTIDGTSVALGKVIEKVEQVKNFSFKMKSMIKGMPNMPTEPVETQMQVYCSNVYGYRCDASVGNSVQSVTYVLPIEKKAVTVMLNMKKYVLLDLTDELITRIKQQSADPKTIIGQCKNVHYTQIGRQNINGIEAEGMETTDPNSMGKTFDKVCLRIWVDPQTELPVLIEKEGSNNDGSAYAKIVCDDFKWDVELDKNIFEPNIPKDYVLMGQVQVPDSNDTEKLAEGFRIFAKWTGGKYPNSLSSLKLSKEIEMALMDFRSPDSGEPNKEEMDSLLKVNTLCPFYSGLLQDQKDPAYHGDVVTEFDPNAVLLRWKIDDANYRIIYGDLTTEDVSRDELTEAEAANPTKILHEIKPPQRVTMLAGHQIDKWHITQSGDVTAYCSLTVIKTPAETVKLCIYLPYSNGKLLSAKISQVELKYVDLGKGKYELALLDGFETFDNQTIEIVWTIPLASLERGLGGFRARLSGLIPLYSYSLDVILEDNCGYDAINDVSLRQIRPFSWNNPTKPSRYLGSCGLMIQKSR